MPEPSDVLEDFKRHISAKRRALICGTGPSLEVFKDAELVRKAEEAFAICCVHSAAHYFNHIDCLCALRGSTYSRDIKPEHYAGKQIDFFVSDLEKTGLSARHVPVQERKGATYVRDISCDISKPMPFSPTTILSPALPAMLFCGIKDICLIGAEYQLQARYIRHDADAAYRTVSGKGVPREMHLAHMKWAIWAQYFEQHGIKVTDFSTGGELVFPKVDINSFLRSCPA
jgi:hypothetical protein